MDIWGLVEQILRVEFEGHITLSLYSDTNHYREIINPQLFELVRLRLLCAGHIGEKYRADSGKEENTSKLDVGA